MPASDDLQFDMAAALVGVMIVLFDLYYKDIQFIKEDSPLTFSVDIWYQEEPVPRSVLRNIENPKLIQTLRRHGSIDFDDFNKTVVDRTNRANGFNCEFEEPSLSRNQYVYYKNKESTYPLYKRGTPFMDVTSVLERFSISNKSEFSDRLIDSGLPAKSSIDKVFNRLSNFTPESKFFFSKVTADKRLKIIESSDNNVLLAGIPPGLSDASSPHFHKTFYTETKFWDTKEYELSSPDKSVKSLEHFHITQSALDLLTQGNKSLTPTLLASFLPYRQFAKLSCTASGENLGDINNIKINIRPKKCIDNGLLNSSCSEKMRNVNIFGVVIDHSNRDKPMTWTIADDQYFPGKVNSNENVGKGVPVAINQATLLEFDLED